jgi:hypothetical protein
MECKGCSIYLYIYIYLYRHHEGGVSPVWPMQPWRQRLGARATSGRCAERSRGARMLQASAVVKARAGRLSGITHAAKACSLTAAGPACVQFIRCVLLPGKDASCKDPAERVGSSPGSLHDASSSRGTASAQTVGRGRACTGPTHSRQDRCTASARAVGRPHPARPPVRHRWRGPRDPFCTRASNGPTRVQALH